MPSPSESAPAILHICRREMLRPLRDEILRISGFHVDSTLDSSSGLSMLARRTYDLVLIDVEGETGVAEAEHLCSEIKVAQHKQKVAFVCNWRVAISPTVQTRFSARSSTPEPSSRESRVSSRSSVQPLLLLATKHPLAQV